MEHRNLCDCRQTPSPTQQSADSSGRAIRRTPRCSSEVGKECWGPRLCPRCHPRRCPCRLHCPCPCPLRRSRPFRRHCNHRRRSQKPLQLIVVSPPLLTLPPPSPPPQLPPPQPLLSLTLSLLPLLLPSTLPPQLLPPLPPPSTPLHY